MLQKFLQNNDRETLVRSAIGLTVRVLGAIAGFAFSVAVARLLGLENTGLFFLAIGVVTIADTVSKLGLDIAVVKIVGADSKTGNADKIAGIYYVAGGIAIMSGLVALALVRLNVDTISCRVFDKCGLALPLEVLVYVIPIFALIHLQAAFFRGCHRVGMSFALQNLIVPGTAVLVLFTASQTATTGSVAQVYLWSSVAALVLGIVVWMTTVGRSRPVFHATAIRELLKIAPPMLQSAILNTVVIRWAAIIFLGIWSSSAELGQFSAAARVAVALSFALMVANAVAAPKLAQLYAQRQTRAMARTGATATVFAIVVASPLLIACLFFPAWLMSLFGSDFAVAGRILLVLAIGELMNVIVGPVGAMLQMSNHEKIYRNCTVVSAITLIVLSVILIPRFGALGAAYASAIALAFTNLLALFFTYRLLGVVPIPVLANRLFRER